MKSRPALASLLVLSVFIVLAVSARAEDPVPHWIWKGEGKSVNLRKTFTAPQDLKRAILVATGDDKMNVFINGARVANSEKWESPAIEDVTDRVVKGGENLVAARAENSGGAAGFLATLTLETESGEKQVIVTDETWSVVSSNQKGWNELNFKAEEGSLVPADKLNALGTPPRDKINAAYLASLGDLRQPEATAIDRIKVPEGFKIELLYSVPKDDQGSWVAMTVDDKGRIIVSDQYGYLYRMTPPAPGEALSQADVERIPVETGHAQGLLWAFDSLYVVLNSNEFGGRGLYRVTDTNGDDQLDDLKLLKKFEEVGGEHGPHSVLLGPDGKSIYVVCGNQTALPEYQESRVPEVWAEDLLLPRIYGKGFMKGVLAPRGWIAKTDPEGKEWEIQCTGFRNEYDAGFNRDGELFSYDADMEWDMNLPWYRPTRVNHVISGAEFGWRNGSGKWPAYYSDSFGAVVDIGPGSPTGVTFGYGAKFPAKYQEAFFICDWSYGKLYAVHLEPKGASYTATFEEFISAQPLPLTDIVIHPNDGAMYFAIGGRRVQSGLYRVTYTGSESTAPSAGIKGGEEERAQRHALEAFHVGDHPEAVEKAWPLLSSDDRALRYAARVAIEHRPATEWQEMALAEPEPQAALAALMALSRVGDKSLQEKVVGKLASFDYKSLTRQQRLDLIRTYALAFLRLGEPSDAQKKAVIAQLDPHYPTPDPDQNGELSQLFVYLQAPSTAEKTVKLLKEAPSQEEQITYAKNLRLLKTGWTPELRKDYFQWFVLAQNYKGGNSFHLFLENIKTDAVAGLTEEQKKELQPILDAKPEGGAPQYTFEPRPFVKNWTVSDLDDVINVGLEGNRDFANGRKMFGAATCFACHRFNQEGGAIGPDLTSVAGKFSPRDLLEQITDPNKEISDQYGAMIFTMNDGSTKMGRIMNLSGDAVRVNDNMLDPNSIISIDRKQLKSMEPSPVSMMPPGLINTLTKDDILDLLAYLLSQGNPDHDLFK